MDPARIGVVGAGMIGQALAVRLSATSHDVMLSNSRGPHTLAKVVASVRNAAGSQLDASGTQGIVLAGTVPEAARFGDLVAVAIPPRAIRDLPPEPFAGKIVIDANNYYPEPGWRLPDLDAGEITSSELLGSVLPGATVVKAFNTIYFRRLRYDSRTDLPLD
jgi:8-hydroxy-5-deazaflavin:NADPH oxidoreductase